jgi:membrane protein DedA with SNARE-associated domain
VVIAVALGGMIGDQLLYLVGRRFGGRILRRFASQKARIRKAQRMIQHRPWLFVIGTRFMYGFRVIGPLLIGASRLPPRIFLPLNIVGALVWALLFTTIGYLGGEVVGPWLHHLDAHLKHWIWLILAVAGGGRPLVAQAARKEEERLSGAPAARRGAVTSPSGGSRRRGPRSAECWRQSTGRAGAMR